MNVKAAVLATAMMLSASAAFAQGAAKSAMATKLMAAENKMLDDLTAHKKEAFFSVIAPGSWSLDEGGWMSIDDFKQAWDQIKITSSKTSEMKVVPIDANSALVTYKLDQAGTLNGQSFPPTVYASTVWTMKKGKWWAVFHQESTPAKK